MIAISYTLTPTIQEYILEIDQFRRSILLATISPTTEMKLRWIALRHHIYGSLNLAGLPLTKHELDHILISPTKYPSDVEHRAFAYKQALEVIRTDWVANPKPLTTSHLGALSLIAQPEHAKANMRALREREPDIKRLLSHINSQQDHPILLAGIMYGQLHGTEIGQLSGDTLPRLTTTLLLAKYGYDCRGMLALEPEWITSPELHQKALESITRYGQLTVWLEHFTKAARFSFEALHAAIHSTESVITDLPAATWLRSPREERILNYLENPASKITNREVQHMFHISQVTASRDLTHLSGLGLLYAHGKGRSVYYTKV